LIFFRLQAFSGNFFGGKGSRGDAGHEHFAMGGTVLYFIDNLG
jgi:hypothetical protein